MSDLVLLVEDEVTLARGLVDYFRHVGYDVRHVRRGDAAFEAVREVQPHVVILDIMLPGMSGLDVLRRRRAEDDTAAVMILSALGDEDDRLLGLDLGADDYMVKPFSPREAVGRVQSLLRRAERLGAAPLVPRRT